MFKYLLLLSFFFLACNNGGTNDDTFFPDAPANPDKIKLLQLVNEVRQSGRTCATAMPAVGAVVWSDTLEAVAKKHSKFMHDNDKLNHVGENGTTVDQRIEAAGYIATFYNENLAKGGATEQEVIELWLNSAAHCENIMDGNVDEIGIGTSGAYWTMVMARR